MSDRSTGRRSRPRSWLDEANAAAAVVLSVIAAMSVSCGKKGPPLPPLVRLPAAPSEFSAARRGDDVVLEFIVPSANTDNTRPANVSRVEVYGLTGSTGVSDDQFLKRGTRVGTVGVKSPRDPNQTVEPEESAADIEPLEGEGLDQGSRARVAERLTSAVLTPVDMSSTTPEGRRGLGSAEADLAMLGPSQAGVTSRTYVGVSFDKRGRPGPMSRRVTVPLGAAPPAPSSPTVTYDETAVAVTWTRSVDQGAADLLPSHPPGLATPTLGYHVYEVSAPISPSSASSAQTPAAESRLTSTPISETKYTDSRIVWGAERCYAVRAVETIGALSLESEERRATCVRLTDTFAPAAPTGLIGVASEGAISLIWEPNSEKDLAGYLVLRGVAPADTLEPITPAPIQATVFNDTVPAGVRYVYAIAAVDHAGNRGIASNRFEEAGR